MNTGSIPLLVPAIILTVPVGATVDQLMFLLPYLSILVHSDGKSLANSIQLRMILMILSSNYGVESKRLQFREEELVLDSLDLLMQ